MLLQVESAVIRTQNLQVSRSVTLPLEPQVIIPTTTFLLDVSRIRNDNSSLTLDGFSHEGAGLRVLEELLQGGQVVVGHQVEAETKTCSLVAQLSS